MADPGYPQAITDRQWDYFDIGIRSADRMTFDYRPVGSTVSNEVEYTFGIDPGAFAFELPPRHPLLDVITDVRRTAWQFRCGIDGQEFTGRILKRSVTGPKEQTFQFSGLDNRFFLKRMCAWVNNIFPPEVQFGITGKQDVVWGPWDPVAKNYVAKVATRQNKPFYVRLPLKWPNLWTAANQIDVGAINTLDDLLDILADTYDSLDLVALQARFTMLDDLFRPTCERLERGVSVDTWDGRGTPPAVFSTDTLGKLQSIINTSSDHFLDISQLSHLGSGLWSNTPPRACYLFDTTTKRDNRKTQFRTDAKVGLGSYSMEELHADATHAVVGGKAPAVLNQAIEIGANLAISAILFGLSMIPGLGGLSGLSLTVGDLFDDVFFAYQVTSDHELEEDIGEDDAFGEIYADNTAAYSLDSYATGKRTLHEHSGTQTLEGHALSGVDGRGIHFGAPETGARAARKYQHGDTVTLFDGASFSEQWVSKVVVGQRRDGGWKEDPSLGRTKRAQGLWERLITGAQDTATSFRGFANSI